MHILKNSWPCFFLMTLMVAITNQKIFFKYIQNWWFVGQKTIMADFSAVFNYFLHSLVLSSKPWCNLIYSIWCLETFKKISFKTKHFWPTAPLKTIDDHPGSRNLLKIAYFCHFIQICKNSWVCLHQTDIF